MTEENRAQNVADELRRAEQALRAAEALVGLGLHADSVSRAYYGVFHVVRALLLSRGVEPRSHAGAVHLLNTEIIRKGLLQSSWNRVVSGLQRSHEFADYDAAVSFEEEDARAELESARAFDAAARDLLRREGFVPS